MKMPEEAAYGIKQRESILADIFVQPPFTPLKLPLNG